MMEIVIITLLSTLTLVQCLRKWGFFDWYQAKYGHIKWLPDGSCLLCFGFWLSIQVACAYILVQWLPPIDIMGKPVQAKWLFVPFACAGLINFISTFLTILGDRNNHQ
jgi:hypothetical protein